MRKVQKFIFGDSKIEMSIRYPSGDAQGAIGDIYMSVKIRIGELLAQR